MNKKIRSVVVVGGGSAGWITAATIAAEHQSGDQDALKVTLIESPNVKPIGVGEGTWPTMRSTLKKIGVSETEFFKRCDASFKQGAKFAKWVTGAADDYYYHPLVLPQGFLHTNLAPFWEEQSGGAPFSTAVSSQDALCDRNLAPKLITTPEYSAVENYAYHLDAGKFSTFIQEHAVANLGVNHILDDVTSINSSPENGDILSLETKQNGALEGDLFVDCTGFASLLLGKHYKVPFIGKKDVLFIDRALAVHVPYKSDMEPIASHTISTAQDSGWIWDIGLSSRKGVGHVYSSSHTDKQSAMDRLEAYVNKSDVSLADLSVKEIEIIPGHREKFWVNNCVAVGLAAGFLEPLEASALVLVELAASAIAEQLPSNRASMDIVAKRFNKRFLYRWDRIIDFLKLHYILSQRTDTSFWIDNREDSTIPDSLKEILELWKYQYPWHDDFTQKDEVFPSASYQYVLYGMGFKTEAGLENISQLKRGAAMREFNLNRDRISKLISVMPTNRELIEKIKSQGMQKV